jgi:hypothetical protein
LGFRKCVGLDDDRQPRLSVVASGRYDDDVAAFHLVLRKSCSSNSRRNSRKPRRRRLRIALVRSAGAGIFVVSCVISPDLFGMMRYIVTRYRHGCDGTASIRPSRGF